MSSLHWGFSSSRLQAQSFVLLLFTCLSDFFFNTSVISVLMNVVLCKNISCFYLQDWQLNNCSLGFILPFLIISFTALSCFLSLCFTYCVLVKRKSSTFLKCLEYCSDCCWSFVLHTMCVSLSYFGQRWSQDLKQVQVRKSDCYLLKADACLRLIIFK